MSAACKMRKKAARNSSSKIIACYSSLTFAFLIALIYSVSVVVKETNFFVNGTSDGLLLKAGYESFVLFIIVSFLSYVLNSYFEYLPERGYGSAAQCKQGLLGVLFNYRIKTSYKDSVRKFFGIYLILLLVMWVPWIAVSWPGILRDDTLAQYMMSFTPFPYEDRHPVFDTLFFELFWRVGMVLGNAVYGLIIYIIFQAIALAAGGSLLLCYIRKYGVPLWIEISAIIYYCTSYVVVAAVPTMSKDSLHTIFMLPLAILFVEICLTKGRALDRPAVICCFVLLAFLSIASKRTALIILLCGGIALFCLAKGRRKKILVVMLIPMAMVECLWQPIVNHSLNVSHYQTKEVMGLIYQPIGRLLSKSPQAIESEDRHAFEGLMGEDLKKVGEVYNPIRVDEVMYTIDVNAPAEVKSRALKAWFNELIRHPDEFAEAYIAVWYGWFSPFSINEYPSNLDVLFTPSFMQQWAAFVNNDIDEANRVLSPFMNRSDSSPWMKEAKVNLHEEIQSPLNSRGVYVTYVPLFVLICLLYRRRWSHLAAWVLIGATSLSFFASPVALEWYPIPLFFILPLFVSLLFIQNNDD